MAKICVQTTRVCLFHDNYNVLAAVRDLLEAGVPQSAIFVVGGATARNEGSETTNQISFIDYRGVQFGLGDNRKSTHKEEEIV